MKTLYNILKIRALCFSVLSIIFITNSLKMQAQPSDSTQDLKRAILSIFQKQTGNYALAFYNFSDSSGFSINGEELFHAASTMKTPVMIELFREAASGAFRLSDSIPVNNEFRSIVDGSIYHLNPDDDSDSAIYRMIGQKLPIRELMYRMIIYSSNLATNILVELAKPARIMQTIREAGTTTMKVLRGVEDNKAYDAGLNNVTTANDLCILFKQIGTGAIVSQQACEEMIRILKDQRHNDIIPAKLPSDVAVAHKTGNITGVEHDGGIIFLPDGKKYVLILLSKDIGNRDSAVDMMANVSRMVYDFVAAKSQ